MTFPKSGTTWLQEILWTMTNNPDLTHPETNTPILDRSVDIAFDFVFDSIYAEFLKFESLRKWFAEVCPGRKEEDGIMLQICELMQGRRIIKCHLPFPFLPPDILETAKIVYVARNPKDAIVSYHSMMDQLAGSDRYFTLECRTRVLMTNQSPGMFFGPYWRHVELAWEQRQHPNMEFIFFEELKADTKKHLQRLNDFLGTNLTQSQLDAVEHHASFKSMKARGEPMRDPLFSNFFRKEHHQGEDDAVYTQQQCSQQEEGGDSRRRSTDYYHWPAQLQPKETIDRACWCHYGRRANPRVKLHLFPTSSRDQTMPSVSGSPELRLSEENSSHLK